MEIVKTQEDVPTWEGKKFDMLKIDSENAAAVTNALCQGFEPFAVCTLPFRSSAFANEMIVKIFIFLRREVPSAKNTVG